MTVDLVVRSRRVVAPGAVGPAAVHVSGGRIAAVTAWEDVPTGCPLEDAGDALLLPGLVDTHVHVNEPGRTEWEGFETATRAAAAGGVTTLVDMPLNSIPPTTTLGGLEAKASAADGKCWVDVAFCAGVVPGNAGELAALRRAGAVAFKCFLAPSGVDEFPPVDAADLRGALARLADLGAPLFVHAELPGGLRPVDEAAARSYQAYLESRPAAAESQAAELLVTLLEEIGSPVHIVHLSAAEALPIVRRARERGLPLSAETCPHYLSFVAEEIADGATAFKCAPPIRGAANRDRLWEALREGLIDQVVSDHSPSPPAMKEGDFARAWGGISSLQLGLPAVWTAARARGFSIEDVVGWMAARPARLAGLSGRKGAIVAGADADLVVFDPDAETRVEPARLEHRHKLTPYAGRALAGAVRATFLRGARVWNGAAPVGRPAGAWLRYA